MEKIVRLPDKEVKLLAKHVDALHLSLEGLLKLLGGTEAKREQYWEILKGLTSVADLEIVFKQIDAAKSSIDTAGKTIGGLSSHS